MNKIGDTLSVIPDSGFQLFFFPLMVKDDIGESVETKLENMGKASGPRGKALYDIIKDNQAIVGWGESWKANLSESQKSGWQASSSPTPFVRHRLGTCWVSENLTLCGLWIAIETNIGDKERGWYFSTDAFKPSDDKLMDAANPYVASSTHELTHSRPFKIRFNGLELAFNVKWLPLSTDDIEVDLILDFGNSRTCALVLERQKPSGAMNSSERFAEICRPLPLRIPFFSDTSDFSVEHAMVSSRFVLKTPEFRAFDWNLAGASSNDRALVSCMPRSYHKTSVGWKFWAKPEESPATLEFKIPNVFTKLSPVCFGDDVAEMVKGTSAVGQQYEKRLQQGQLMQQSSAKRFFWDDIVLDSAKYGDTWSMMPNFGDEAYKLNTDDKIPLAGLMLRFQPHDGSAWSFDRPPNLWGRDGDRRGAPMDSPPKPVYPRRNTLTWSILAIMETAQRYINSPNWTVGGQATRRRRIRTVVGTYPSGWSSSELEAYRAKWQEALNIFTLTQYPSGTSPVRLEMNLDESVASQLPLIYSCIKSFTNDKRGENWIQLNGVDRPGKMPAIKVMNLDIGGGTTDVSVVEYVDEEKGVDVDLRATVKFRDSYAESGDGLLKLIIEEILLPKLAGSNDKTSRVSNAKFREVFEEVGIDAGANAQPVGSQHQQALRTTQRVRWHVSVLVPLAIKLLNLHAQGKETKFKPSEANITPDVWSKFGAEFSLAHAHGAELQFGKDALDRLVERHFGLLIKSLADVVTSFDVHMIFVCGKPSEQPAIRKLVERLMPIPLERIHFASGFRSGTWYPFRRKISLDSGDAGGKASDILESDANERIDDAKTVTCVGAALSRAISAGLIPGWKMDIAKEDGLSNHWGELSYDPENGVPRSFIADIVFPNPGVSSEEVILGMGENRWIGRKLFPGESQRPEPVYKLRWLGKDSEIPEKVRVVFRRVPATAECADALEIVNVRSLKGDTDLNGKVRLRLEPVTEVSWLDTGRLFTR